MQNPLFPLTWGLARKFGIVEYIESSVYKATCLLGDYASGKPCVH